MVKKKKKRVKRIDYLHTDEFENEMIWKSHKSELNISTIV